MIMAMKPMASRVIDERLPGKAIRTDDHWLEFMRKTCNTASHQTSTCRMGNDAMSVVDERLRVRVVDGLKVVDASIMPHVTSGHTNAPSLMIGAKGAAIIIVDAVSRARQLGISLLRHAPASFGAVVDDNSLRVLTGAPHWRPATRKLSRGME
ncbi:GMC oxidoreductase [Paraburkholderia youngii]|uniref:Glucose-methanol-choline oxidoreductase C-terminal domain-containing protein n=1 Tax=Paraburkholderia youngii TaxID=2782701 RepID=A0A7Y6JVI6_9BURK|nr:hypothetical protein [Paraburkholderia youngii]